MLNKIECRGAIRRQELKQTKLPRKPDGIQIFIIRDVRNQTETFEKSL